MSPSLGSARTRRAGMSELRLQRHTVVTPHSVTVCGKVRVKVRAVRWHYTAPTADRLVNSGLVICDVKGWWSAVQIPARDLSWRD